MKATITYTLPEETEAFVDAQNGVKYKIILESVARELRNKIKYSDGLAQEQQQCYEEIRDLVFALLEEENLHL